MAFLHLFFRRYFAGKPGVNNVSCFVRFFLFSFWSKTKKTEEVWINETCLKAKIKASAWKTIRKTQYDNYEDYFQVFRGFSKKSYPAKTKSNVEKHHSYIDPVTFCFPFFSFPAVDIWTMWIWKDLPTVNLIVWPGSSELSRTGSKCISFCYKCCNPGRYP